MSVVFAFVRRVCYSGDGMNTRRKKSSSNRGRWQVQRERACISDTFPPGCSKEAQSIGDIIPSLMQKFGMQNSPWVSDLEELWVDVVGTDVARHSRPGQIDGKTLIVFVDNSVWLSELTRYGKARMLANVQKQFGKKRVSEIRLRLDPEGTAAFHRDSK